MQRFVIADANVEAQSLDPVGMLDALRYQNFALPADQALIFVGERRNPDHRTNPRFTSDMSHQRTDQHLAIDPVSLGTAMTP